MNPVTKMKPGQTYTAEVGGQSFTLRVLSMFDKARLSDVLQREAQTLSERFQTWAEAIAIALVQIDGQDVAADQIVHSLTDDQAFALINRITAGSTIDEDEAKN